MDASHFRALSVRSVAAFAVGAALLALANSPTDSPVEQGARQVRPFVILLRHAEAPGRGEPENFDLNDCSTQRNLSDKGRDEAKMLGDSLRAMDIKVSKILASRWCRARQTAQLLDLGPVEDDRAFDNLDINKNRSQALLDSERSVIAAWRGPGALVVVTHSSNLKALTELAPESGSIIVAQPGEGADRVRVERVAVPQRLATTHGEPGLE